jgi:hypothetical protein
MRATSAQMIRGRAYGLRISGGRSRELARARSRGRRSAASAGWPARSDGQPADGNPQADGAARSVRAIGSVERARPVTFGVIEALGWPRSAPTGVRRIGSSQTGLMFGLRRKKLSGSYFFFSAANRS